MSWRSRTSNLRRRDADMIAFARDQRARANEFSRILWQIVRNRGLRHQKFRREYPIPPFIADFCCVELPLIIEVDGEHHLHDEGRKKDATRDQFLSEHGYEILRFTGYDLLRDATEIQRQIENAIDRRMTSLTPSPSPTTSRRRGEQ